MISTRRMTNIIIYCQISLYSYNRKAFSNKFHEINFLISENWVYDARKGDD